MITLVFPSTLSNLHIDPTSHSPNFPGSRHVISDAATASAALQNREIDWFEQPPRERQKFLMRVGDVPDEWAWIGAFTPGTAMASESGMEALRGPRSIDRAEALLRDAGALGPMTRLIGPTDILAPSAMTQVCAALFRDVGLNAHIALSDWGTVIQRRASREPVEKGGWVGAADGVRQFRLAGPSGHSVLRANGAADWFG